MISVRPAANGDIETVCALDAIALRDEQRRAFISDEVAAGNCFVAVNGDNVIGYGVLNYTFFHTGFIDMLYIDADHRRTGAGTLLVRHMETRCRTPKLFTSTNLSNTPMQSLLLSLGYIASGVINNLDDGDPEVVFFKRPG